MQPSAKRRFTPVLPAVLEGSHHRGADEVLGCALLSDERDGKAIQARGLRRDQGPEVSFGALRHISIMVGGHCLQYAGPGNQAAWRRGADLPLRPTFGLSAPQVLTPIKL